MAQMLGLLDAATFACLVSFAITVNGDAAYSGVLSTNGEVRVLYEATDAPVHQWIAYQAYKKLRGSGNMTVNMEREFQQHVGAESDDDAHLVEGWVLSDTSWDDDAANDLPARDGYELLEGSWEEDGGVVEWDASLAWTRPLNHFWNPDATYDAGLNIFGYNCHSALTTAQERFSKALAAYSDNDKELAYYWLGRTAHLLMDMSVPAHVALLDHHSYDGYENFTKSSGLWRRNLTYTSALTDIPDYKAIFTYLRSFDEEDPGDKYLTALMWDLAEHADDFGACCNYTYYPAPDSGYFRNRVFGLSNYDDDWLIQQQQLESRAIGYVAALYQLFWERTAKYREIQVTVSVSPVGKGLKVEVDGVEYTEGHTFEWEKGVSHDIVTAYCQNGYNWESWSDVGASENWHTITPQADDQYVASFVMQASAQLVGLAIAGPSAIAENGTGQFTATAYLSDGSSMAVFPAWSEDASVTSISASGILSAGSVSGNTSVTVSATYTAGGITKTSSAVVTVVDSRSSGESQTVHALANGTFEGGASSWGISGAAEVIDGSYPRSGARYAYLCNTNSAVGAIYQFFPVPAGTRAATLTFYLNVASEETATYSKFDTLSVQLASGSDELVGTVAEFSNLDKRANGSYVYENYNIMPLISGYVGDGLFLCFHGEADDSNSTIFRIDDIDVALTVDSPVSLTGLNIRGPSSIPEGVCDAFTAEAFFSDGTIQAVSASSWSENSSAASLSAEIPGILYAGQVDADTTVTLAASYSFNGVTKSATKSVIVADTSVTKAFTRLSVYGPSSIDEFSAGQFNARAFFSDGSYLDVSPVWSENSAAANISDSGLFSAGEVSCDESVAVCACYTVGGVTRVGIRDVLINNVGVTPALVSLSVDGSGTVNESCAARYRCLANYSDGSLYDVSSSATWYENTTFTSISSDGVLLAGSITSNLVCRITATYGSLSATKSVTVRDVSVTVTLDAQGGSVSPSSLNFLLEEACGELPVATRENFTFDGWWTEPDGSGDQITEATVATTALIKLYARWVFQFAYAEEDGQITITGYSGPGGEVAIPAFIGDSPVMHVGPASFSNCRSLTGVSIPSGVSDIGDFAFNGTGLTNIEIPEGVTSVGSSVFDNCLSLTNIWLSSGVTSMGGYGTPFLNCPLLTSVNVANDNPAYSSEDGVLFNKDGTTLLKYPDGRSGYYCVPNVVTNVGDTAFYLCTKLTSIDLGTNICNIGSQAFGACMGLTGVRIPRSVANIGQLAFEWCFSLSSITVDSESLAYASEDGVLFDKDRGTLLQYPPARSGSSYVITSSVTKIEQCAFRSCCGLTNVCIPESVSDIGYRAFGECSGLSDIVIPDSVTRIGALAFVRCDCLVSATIGARVASVGVDAFYGCSRLKGLYFRGDAPDGGAGVSVFSEDSSTIVYCLPGKIGWTEFFSGRPTAPWSFRVLLHFDGRGGFVFPDSMEVNYGDRYGLLPSSTRAGHIFAGWFTDLSFSSLPLTSETIVTNLCDMTLYAKWSIETMTTPSPIPTGWFDQYPVLLSAAGGNYEDAAFIDWDCDGQLAWQEYVAGTVPTNKASVFKASIGLNGDSPWISWLPDLGAARVYTVEGKTNLNDSAWGPTNAESRFFRVKVDLP